MSCNHNVGRLYDNFIYINDVCDYLKKEAIAWTDHSRVMGEATGMESKIYKPVYFIDQRRGLMLTFNFCPYCGEKINWRKIKKLLTKEDL